MTLKDAKQLRDTIKAAGWDCAVPRRVDGEGGNDYSVRIRCGSFECRFYEVSEWEEFHAATLAEMKRLERERPKPQPPQRPRPRSPIEAMIDRACGFTPEGR